MSTFKVTIEMEEQRLNDLLCNALEGGSNYWYRIENYDQSEHECEFLSDIPMAGGTLTFTANGDDEREVIHGCDMWTLTREHMVKGAQTMAEKYPRHWANVVNENDDGETGDVFLQCCLFGEVIYG